MEQSGLKSLVEGIERIGINKAKNVYWNLSPAELVEHAILNGEGILTNDAALACDTGRFTGRSPDDKYFVKDELTKDSIHWGDINHPIDGKFFDVIFHKMLEYSEGKELYVRDAFVCADFNYRKSLRVITTKAYHNLFSYNMFVRPELSELQYIDPEYTILCFPEFEANPETDGVRCNNFSITDLTRKVILIGGTAYTGEIKKSIFSILNFVLPHQHQVLPMHASANIGKEGKVAVFFGLSGTGKTTLSADPDKFLIGDDEHGWDDKGVFNFEGGCYAKVANLDATAEPEIYGAIKFGSVLENVKCYPYSREVDYTDTTITLNTRVSYPIEYIPNAAHPSKGGLPSNIFFLTADAFGVLPPISKLTPAQAMYHFISGYTAKVAGTEEGVDEPKPVFSACFGAPFMPLHPTVYANLLGEKMKKNKVNIWLINTGWTGGAYGTGSRIKLKFTRAMITAACEGKLEHVNFKKEPFFGLMVPDTCPEVPNDILLPYNTWKDKEHYKSTAKKLSDAFIKNFEAFSSYANEEIRAGAPVVIV